MQKDNLSIIFNLLVVTPGVYAIKHNSITIKDFDVAHRGMHFLECAIELEHDQEHKISLRVDAVPDKTMAVINNVSLVWPQDINDTRTARMIKNRDPAEVWDYSDAKASQTAMNHAINQRHRMINLDYMLDNNTPGYINRYCKFVGDDGQIDSLTFNRGRLYNIKRSGEFIFTFRTPIAYWLLERFFKDPAI